MNQHKLQQAIQFAIDHETDWPSDDGEGWDIHHLDPPPWNRLLGDVHARGPVSGTIILDSKTVTSWGEPERPDLTFSVAKTYLALLAGVAFDQDCFIDKLGTEKTFAIYEVSVDFPSDYQRLCDANFNDPAGSASLATKCQQ